MGRPAGPGLLAGALAVAAGLASAVFAAASLVGFPNVSARAGRATAARDVGVPHVLRRLAPGRPLVVYVAAAPCRSCLGGARTLSAAARRRPGIAFAAVAAGDAPREAARFFRLARWPGARLLDERGTLAGGLGVRSLPTTLVLSAQRSVVLRIEGAIGAALVVRAALRA